MAMLQHTLRTVLLISLLTTTGMAQTGKITGRIVDAETGEVLPGVNVILEDAQQGATTNTEGIYTILNVSPGTYTLRASFVGYADAIAQGVDVSVDLTTTIDFQMQEETQELQEVTVQASQPIVRPDVSANVSTVEMTEMENIPVTNVEEIIGLQAGIEPGMRIRGSDESNVGFMVDGMSMRNPRDNTPFSGISYTSVKEVQVQTGGFNAEYGNLRSGLVNLTLKEGTRDRYTVDALVRYTSPSRKYFGLVPDDPNAYWMRPYLDEDVAFVGTHTEESPWDEYMRRQYPQWQGYNTISEQLQEDNDLANLSPQEAQQVFEWYHRKDFSPTAPDYEIDASIGGPIPIISEQLGNLRFFSSYRQTQSAYIVPKLRDTYRDRTFQLKLTSNISSSIKLNLIGLVSTQAGINASGTGMFTGRLPSYPWTTGGLATSIDGVFDLFANEDRSKMDIARQHIGAHFTHSLGPNTFYTAQLQRKASRYLTVPGRPRDPSVQRTVGGMELDEAPFGYYNQTWLYSPISGMAIGGVWGTTRDSSDVNQWTASADLTHQISSYSQLKGGVDFWYTDYNSQLKSVAPAFPIQEERRYWHRQTWQGAAYVQNKLEFEGLVANVGLRLDYFQPTGQWWDYELFSDAFASNTFQENVEKSPVDPQVKLSPRVGLSFPVTANSKLYFNYGHFRDVLNTQELFQFRTIQSETKVERIGNPGHPMMQSVAYELGYDQNLFDQFLLRISGYYKAQSKQPRYVWFTALGGETHYQKPLPLNYGDVRGAEFTLTKNRGRWLRGFVNFTYMARKEGNFGYSEIYENRAQMRDEIRETRQHYQEKPIPQPYARFNVELVPPQEFGPNVLGRHPLADLRVSLLGDWRAGQVFTWDNNANIDIQHNVRWRSYYMFDMRVSKRFDISAGSVQLFADFNNVFNLRHINRYSAFVGSFDFEEYMQSLHLPEDTFEDQAAPYLFVNGDDRPGDFRSRDVEFVPIEVVEQLPETGTRRTQGKYGPLYYVKPEGAYHIWNGESWQEPDSKKVDQVLDDKAYIDMPNSRSFTFLNPRDIFFGVRFTF